MFALVKRDFLAIPYYVYLLFLLLPIPLLLLDLGILFTSVIMTVIFWAIVYGSERYRKTERFFVSLPISRHSVITARYIATFFVLFVMIGYTYLLTIAIYYWDESRLIIVVPDGVTLYIIICLALIFISLVLPNSYLFASYQMPVYIVSVQFFILLFLSGEVFLYYSLNKNLSYDTGNEATLFIYERGPWVSELSGMIQYYLPIYPFVSLAILTVVIVGGSYWVSIIAYRQMNIG